MLMERARCRIAVLGTHRPATGSSAPQGPAYDPRVYGLAQPPRDLCERAQERVLRIVQDVAFMHMGTPTSIGPKVTSSSFQTDAAIVWENRCQNRDLRAILSLEPTGFGGFNSQATTKPPTGPHSTMMHTSGWVMASGSMDVRYRPYNAHH